MARTERALISVYDKTGIDKLAKALQKSDVKIFSTSGTAAELKKKGIGAEELSKITGHNEYPGGLVKTLNEKLFFSILADRKKKEHMEILKADNIEPFELVVVNLYPFWKTKRLEDIDIGGVSLIRAAAKNYKNVAVVVNPGDYGLVSEMIDKEGRIDEATSKILAYRALSYVAAYDALIAGSFSDSEQLPENLNLSFKFAEPCRYGENYHQKAAIYRKYFGKAELEQLHGKQMSFNNYLDIDIASNLLSDFSSHFPKKTAAVVVKHTHPCGIALADTPSEAFRLAWDCDKISAFGSIIGINGVVDKKTAESIGARFIEIIIAHDFNKDALQILMQKKNLRLVKTPKFESKNRLDLRFTENGLLAQTKDDVLYEKIEAKSGSFDEKNTNLMRFGMICVKHMKSNSIVIARKIKENCQLLGSGLGQPNRLESTNLAIKIALRNLKDEGKDEKELSDTLFISDAFIGFRDNIDLANKHGIKNIIEPGGSIHDEEIIKLAKEYKLNLIFTGTRHFRH